MFPAPDSADNPVESTTEPDTSAAWGVCRETSPVTGPPPEIKVIAPPGPRTVFPPETTTGDPVPELDVPTTTDKEPAAPELATPVLTRT